MTKLKWDILGDFQTLCLGGKAGSDKSFIEMLCRDPDRQMPYFACLCECTISECLKSDEVLLKLGPPEVWNLNDPMHQSVDKNAFSMSDSRLWCQYCPGCQWTFGLLPHQFLPRKSFPRHKVQGHQMNFTQFAVGKKVSSSHYLKVFLEWDRFGWLSRHCAYTQSKVFIMDFLKVVMYDVSL